MNTVLSRMDFLRMLGRWGVLSALLVLAGWLMWRNPTRLVCGNARCDGCVAARRCALYQPAHAEEEE